MELNIQVGFNLPFILTSLGATKVRISLAGARLGAVASMRCGLIGVLAAALTAVAAAEDAPAVAVAPASRDQLPGRRSARRGQYPYLALVANMWGECSAVILAPRALLGPSSCLPKGYLHTGRVEAGNSRFFSMQDFGDSPTQGRIIDKYFKLTPETPGGDSLMLIKLLLPFDFSSFVQAIPIATEIRSRPVRALVVGYGLGGEEMPHRQQTAAEVLLDDCQPWREEAVCVAAGPPDCRPDHGAAVVTEGKLLAVASNESLCTGAVLLVAPHREWITERVRGFGDRLHEPDGAPAHRAATAAAGLRSLSLPLPWLAAALAACACRGSRLALRTPHPQGWEHA